MGRILPNGEIVHDDGPQQGGQQRRNPRMGTVQQSDHTQQQEGDNQQQQGMMGQVSIFDTANQRLVDNGFPRWNAGPYVVEPIVSVGILLAGLFAGFAGIIFAGLLFFVCKYSTGEGNSSWWRGGGRGNGGGRNLGGSGGGRRLGGPSISRRPR
ncbi:protein FAM241B-like [Antedon mediterranea]|uniref:protein FAM241B-like n=1 Tax=Antedon mediterranea TaxID=105859 RepID=UPI003AF8BF88